MVSSWLLTFYWEPKEPFGVAIEFWSVKCSSKLLREKGRLLLRYFSHILLWKKLGTNQHKIKMLITRTSKNRYVWDGPMSKGPVYWWRALTRTGWKATLRYSTGHWAKTRWKRSMRSHKAGFDVEKIISPNMGLLRPLRNFRMEKFD